MILLQMKKLVSKCLKVCRHKSTAMRLLSLMATEDGRQLRMQLIFVGLEMSWARK